LYTTERDDSPIDEFLDGLDMKSRAKVAAHLSLLEEQGPNLKRPYADIVRGKIRELRIHFSSNSVSYPLFLSGEGSNRLAPCFFKEDAAVERDGVNP
jgi:hypothetical protein